MTHSSTTLWTETTLGAEVEILTGFPFKSAEYSTTEGDIPLLRGDNVVQGKLRWDNVKRWSSLNTQHVSHYFLRENDIVLAMDRPWIEAGLKYASILPDDLPCLLVQRVACLRAKETLDQKFLKYVIGSADFTNYVLSIQTGTAIPHISSQQIKDYRFTLPPLPVQREIAHILGSLDDKIELNRQMNATLESMARALFKSWFVSFDPVRAKAEGRQPDGMDAETAALFPDSFEDSELGEIPAGWGVGTLGDYVDINSKSLSKSDVLHTIRYIEISAVSRGDIQDVEVYSRGEEPSRARRRLRHGDTVVSTVRPDRASYFLCLYPSEDLIASTGFAVLTPKIAQWSFVHAYIARDEIFEHLGHLADGAAYPSVSTQAIANLEIVLPPCHVLEMFHQICSPLYEMAYSYRCESQTLAATRDALLPRLMAGEVGF